MTLTEILQGQLVDPFRIGLIVALVATTLRTATVTGRVVPLLAGVGFVAAIIPATTQAGSAEPMWRLVMTGVLSNIILLAIVLAARAAFLRLRL